MKNPPDSRHVVSWFVALLDNCVKALRIRTLDCWKREQSEAVRDKSRVVLPADSDGFSAELSAGFIPSSHACTRSTCLSHHCATGAIRQKGTLALTFWFCSGQEYSTGTEGTLQPILPSLAAYSGKGNHPPHLPFRKDGKTLILENQFIWKILNHLGAISCLT